MNILQSIKHFFQVTEADVIKLFIAIQKGEQIVIADAQKALGWIVANAHTITADLTKVEGIVAALGLSGNPSVTAAMAGATTAANEFIKFAQAYPNQTTTQTVATGYQALVDTKAAVANALAAAVK